MAATDPGSLEFGRFRFDPERQILLRDETPVALGTPQIALLAALLTNRGQLVSRESLLDAAWPGRAVEESNLSVHVARLRKVLGHTPDGQQWITTVHRRGYRFLPWGTGSAKPIPKLAVTPFTGAPAAASVSEEVKLALTRFRSVALATGAGHERARYVLGGKVRSTGPGESTAVELADQISGTTVWMAQMSSGLEARVPLPASIAASAEAEILAAEIRRMRNERPNGKAAYDHYLWGRMYLQSSRESDNCLAHRHLQDAIALEPENGMYLAASTEALHHRMAVGWTLLSADHKKHTHALVHRASDRLDGDAVSLALIGVSMFTVDEEDLGLVATERALTMNPNSPLVLVCSGLTRAWNGELDAAEPLFQRSLALAPNDPNQRLAAEGLAMIRHASGDYEGALFWARRGQAYSTGLSALYWMMISASAHLGRRDDAERYLARFNAVSPGVTIRGIRDGQHYRHAAHIGSLAEGLRLAGMPES